MYISRWLYYFLTATCMYAGITFMGLFVTEWVAPTTLGETLNALLVSYPLDLLFFFALMKFWKREKR